MCMLGILAALAFTVLANAFNGVGLGPLIGQGRGANWLASIALFALILVFAGIGAKSRWDGAFVDRDNRISLSRFQLVLWLLLLVSSLFTAGLSNAFGQGDGTAALNIKIPEEIWALLGLGALTAVAAPAIKDIKRGAALAPAQTVAQDKAVIRIKADQRLNATPTFDGEVLTKDNPDDARWMDMILGDYEGSGYVDASKLQQLAFTILIIVVYASALWGKMNGNAPIKDFPDVSAGFLALLSISHAAYLADKQLAKT